MKSEIKRLDNSIVELTIEEWAKNVNKYRQKAIDYLKDNAKIDGFRKWSKIPDNLIVKNFWEAHIASMTVEYAMDELYKQALKKHNLLPVSQAEIKEVVSNSPLKVIVNIEVFPEIEIDKSYKKVKIKKTEVNVDDSQVDKALEDIQTRFTKFEKAEDDYKCVIWDRVTIDTDWYDDDWNLLETTSMRAYPIQLGSNMLVKWFEESIAWSKNGEELEFDVVFPDDYHNAEFASKKVKFKVKVNLIEKSVKPEFTPEFIKDLRWKDLDLEWFRALVKEEIRDTSETNARLEDENKLIEELLKITKLDIWKALLANQIEKVFVEIKENIVQSWAKVDDYIASLGMDEETYKEKNVKSIALRRLQAELILHRLMEMEKFEVDEKEIGEEIEKIIDRYGNDEVKTKMRELYKAGTKYYEEVKSRINYRKLIDTFFE